MKYIKYFLTFMLLLIFFVAFNTSLDFKLNAGFIEALIFAFVTTLLIFHPQLKRLTLIISNILFIIMAILFLPGQSYNMLTLIDSANFFASLGFGILIISLIFYLPQIIKKGYISEI